MCMREVPAKKCWGRVFLLLHSMRLVLFWPGLEGSVGPLKFAVSLALICHILGALWENKEAVEMMARVGSFSIVTLEWY